MINPNTGLRELAYTVTIEEIRPLAGYDRVEHARVGNWWVVVRKDQFKVGDLGIYFEIDSKVPEKEPFMFLESKKFKIKTQKMCKVYSQGLLMSLDDFADENGNLPDWATTLNYDEVTFLTEILGVTYSVKEDNERKSNGITPAKIPWYARIPLLKWFFKSKVPKTNPTNFPFWFPYVEKTDEERVENLPVVFLQNKTPYRKTLKIDGTSTTFIMDRKHEFYVCSRNKRIIKPKQQGFYEGKLYWDMAEKYGFETICKTLLKENPNWEYVAFQGETAGPGVQGNPHNLPDVRFYIFNFIDSVHGRWDILEAAKYLVKYGLSYVPIVSEQYILPDDFEEFKESADGTVDNYLADAHGKREGFVYRSITNPMNSFKNVSRKYLLAKGE